MEEFAQTQLFINEYARPLIIRPCLASNEIADGPNVPASFEGGKKRFWSRE